MFVIDMLFKLQISAGFTAVDTVRGVGMMEERRSGRLR